ncbi:MAG: metallophosphoesterase [Clostridia bacterium]|nr:metallophosphoesterase [Clostridia bacterium]
MKKLRKLACVLALILVLAIPAPAISVAGLNSGTYYIPGSPIQTESAYLAGSTYGDVASNWLTTAPNIGNYDYSFSVMGDIQIVNNYFPDELSKLFDYVVDNAAARNTKFCFNMGDITDKDKTEEWVRAKEGYDRVGKLMPYSLLRGNHDGRAQMEKYFGGNSAYMNSVDGSYMGKSYMTYQTFSVGIHKYLVLTLDWFVDEIHLQWANDIISAHPDYNAIVCVHCFLGKASQTATTVAPTQPSYPFTQSSYTYNLDINNTDHATNPSLDGIDIWNALKGNKNLKLILSGHIAFDDVGYWEGTGTNGNKVVALLVCPQDVDVSVAYGSGSWKFPTTSAAYQAGKTGSYNGMGAGIMTTLYIDSSDDSFFVEHYSVLQQKWFKSSSQFSFNLDLISINDNSTGSLYTPVIGM